MATKEVQFLEDTANHLRILSILSTTAAGSGHPSSCMSAAEIMSTLFFNEMVWDPTNLESSDPDEFILSKGHAAPIYYAALALAGAIHLDQLETLRKFDSPLEGHPMPRLKGVKAATGSLGQGLSVGLGIALAQRLDKSKHRTFVLLGDGEMAEGQVWEAMNAAAYHKVNNLIAFVDANRLAQSGETMHAHRIAAYVNKAKAFGWNAVSVNGHKVSEIKKALDSARSSKQPTMIVCKTSKGKGFSEIENKDGWHGKPLTPELASKAIHELEGKMHHAKLDPSNFTNLPTIHKRSDEDLPLPLETKDTQSTRDAFGHYLPKLGYSNKSIVVIDGDVQNSTRTKEFGIEFPKRFFQGFIAEQNMVSMCAGLSAKGYSPITSTFAAFFTRAHDQIRMANYSNANMLLVGSHSGVSIGEDGPSQMGLEDISMIRTLPSTTVLYPCDSVSTQILTGIGTTVEGITYLRTTRGKTPQIYNTKNEFYVGGSNVVYESKSSPKVAIVAAGTTVHEAISAAKKLSRKKIPSIVIDAYSIKPIDKDRLATIAKRVKHIITVEDHSIIGGLGDAVLEVVQNKCKVTKLGVNIIPRSGTPAQLRKYAEIDADAIVATVTDRS